MLGLQTLETWLFKTASAKALKGLLDKLPLDGGKSLLGALLVVLGDIAQELPAASYAPYIGTLIDVVNAAGPVAVLGVGTVTFLVGITHKLLKFFNPTLPEVVAVPVAVPVSAPSAPVLVVTSKNV